MTAAVRTWWTVQFALARWHPWLVAAACLAPFTPLLVPDDRCLPDLASGDFVAYQLPIREYVREELTAGRFPLWVAHLGAGLPLHAGQQASVCHPLVTPLVLLLGAEYGLKLCLFLHLTIAFAGTYRLARYHDISRPASSMAAVLTTWSGFAICHLMAGHLTVILQYALVPWFFLALAALLRRPGPLPTVGLAALASCLAVSGHPQIFYYSILFGGLWAGGSLLAGVAARARARCIGWGVSAASLALFISAVQLLPSLELAADGLGESVRQQADFAARHALTGLDMVRFFVPNVAGNPFAGSAGPAAGGNFHERVVYLGLLAPARSKHLWPMSPTLRVRNRQFRPTLRASAQTGRGSRHASKGGVQERGFGQGERPMKVEHVDS